MGTVVGDATESNGSDGAPEGARIPRLQFVYRSDVTLSEMLNLGSTIEGTRRIVPITGGTFTGPAMSGQILNIGADWNLARGDGGTSVEAAYYLRTDDGVTIRVVNKGVGGGGPPEPEKSSALFFMFTTPVFEAPSGKYDWLNRATFVATLGAYPDATNVVIIRVFKVI